MITKEQVKQLKISHSERSAELREIEQQLEQNTVSIGNNIPLLTEYYTLALKLDTVATRSGVNTPWVNGNVISHTSLEVLELLLDCFMNFDLQVLLRGLELTGTFKPDFNDELQDKWYVYIRNGEYRVRRANRSRALLAVYFPTREEARELADWANENAPNE